MFVLFDIGGTHTRVTTSRGEDILDPVIYSTPTTYKEGIHKLIETITLLVKDEEIDSIVGGLPGILDKKTGMLSFAPHLSQWVHKDLAENLKEHFHAPIFIQNDAALAGLGEAIFGAGKGAAIMAFMTVSTGVGGARIVQGKIDQTMQGFEPGHQLISPGLHLEDAVSGTAVEKKYKKSPHDIHDETIWKTQAKLLAQGIHNLVVFWSPAVIVLGGLHNILHALRRADVAGVDPEARGAALGRLDRALVVEMDVGDDRDLRLAHDVLERAGGFLVGAGDADDVRPGALQRLDLLDRRLRILRQGVGHRLHGDRRVATNGHVSDPDLAALAAMDVPVRPNAHHSLLYVDAAAL